LREERERQKGGRGVFGEKSAKEGGLQVRTSRVSRRMNSMKNRVVRRKDWEYQRNGKIGPEGLPEKNRAGVGKKGCREKRVNRTAGRGERLIEKKISPGSEYRNSTFCTGRIRITNKKKGWLEGGQAERGAEGTVCVNRKRSTTRGCPCSASKGKKVIRLS